METVQLLLSRGAKTSIRNKVYITLSPHADKTPGVSSTCTVYVFFNSGAEQLFTLQALVAIQKWWIFYYSLLAMKSMIQTGFVNQLSYNSVHE